MKGISGQSRASNRTAPDVNELVNRFAEKMSNAVDVEEDNIPWKPLDAKYSKVTSFKVCIKTVLETLKALDVNKPKRGTLDDVLGLFKLVLCIG